jgi:hypothetical protein
LLLYVSLVSSFFILVLFSLFPSSLFLPISYVCIRVQSTVSVFFISLKYPSFCEKTNPLSFITERLCARRLIYSWKFEFPHETLEKSNHWRDVLEPFTAMYITDIAPGLASRIRPFSAVGVASIEKHWSVPQAKYENLLCAKHVLKRLRDPVHVSLRLLNLTKIVACFSHV